MISLLRVFSDTIPSQPWRSLTVTPRTPSSRKPHWHLLPSLSELGVPTLCFHSPCGLLPSWHSPSFALSTQKELLGSTWAVSWARSLCITSHPKLKVSAIGLCILQMREWKVSGIKEHAQGHKHG